MPATVSRRTLSAHQGLERRVVAALHRRFDLEARAVAAEGDDGGDPAALAVGDQRVARVEAAADLDRIPRLGVADVVERHVVVRAPEERHVAVGRRRAQHVARRGLAHALGDHPVLDAHRLARSRSG